MNGLSRLFPMLTKEERKARIQTAMATPAGKKLKLVFACMWGMLLLYVCIVIALLVFVPSCHLMHVPAAEGCVVEGVDYSGFITILVFFNILWPLFFAAVQSLTKDIFTLLYFSRVSDVKK